MKNSIKIFSPATVANVACGYDVLGFCIDSIGDEMRVFKTEEKGIRITKIEGCELPYSAEENVTGVSALAMYNALNPDCGFNIEIYKKIKPGSGIGSSAASAVGSVFAMNELLGQPYSKIELLGFALKGEAIASKSEHADNVAPALFGGFTLVKSISPLQILEIPTPTDLYVTIIHPQIEIKTSESRAILPDNIPLEKAIQQWANVGSLIHALHTSDYDLIKESLTDHIIEPYRSQLIPHFNEVKSEVLRSGALGCSISGSGPSIFALSKGKETALMVESAMRQVYINTKIDFQTYVSKINTEGVKIIK